MTGLELVVVVAIGGAMYTAVKRSDSHKAGARPVRPRRSRLVMVYNNTGAAPLTSPDAGGAAAEVAGRVVGRTVRRGGRGWQALRAAAQRTERDMAETARQRQERIGARLDDRWERRRSTRPGSVVDKWRTLRDESRPVLRRAKDKARRRPRPIPEQPDETTRPTGRPTEQQSGPQATPRPIPTRPRTMPSGGPTVTASTIPDGTAGSMPADAVPPEDWRAMIDRVANFVPEDDTALIAFMKTEAAGVVGYAEGLEQARENCINVLGLDPSAVQGISIYSEHVSDASDRMAEALKQFMTVYGEVLDLRASGVTLPFDGRWFTGETS